MKLLEKQEQWKEELAQRILYILESDSKYL